jgi:hypothetical protein
LGCSIWTVFRLPRLGARDHCTGVLSCLSQTSLALFESTWRTREVSAGWADSIYRQIANYPRTEAWDFICSIPLSAAPTAVGLKRQLTICVLGLDSDGSSLSLNIFKSESINGSVAASSRSEQPTPRLLESQWHFDDDDDDGEPQ